MKKNAIILWLVLTFFTIYVLSPIIWLVLSSFMGEADLIELSQSLHMSWRFTLTNYKKVLGIVVSEIGGQTGIFTTSFYHTFIYSFFTAVIALLVSCLAAYSYVYFKFPLKRQSFIFLIYASMIPGWSVAVPIYLYLRSLQLFDTFYALIFVYVGYLIPFCVWMMTSFMKKIPIDLFEAAILDGCSNLKVFRIIILPLVAPGLVAIFIFSFLSTWGEFSWAIILTSNNIKPLTVTLTMSTGYWGALYGVLSAQGTIAIIAPIILAIVLQKYIVKGLTLGAVKG